MGNTLNIDSTEGKILDAAKKVFTKKGMYGARMQEIADEAGINKALLHYYFRSKDKLFDAIFHEAFHDFVPRAFKSFKSEMPFEDKLSLFVSNYIDIIIENPYLPLFIINEINQKPERLGQLMQVVGLVQGTIFEEINATNTMNSVK